METVSLKSHFKMFWSFIALLLTCIFAIVIITITFINSYTAMATKISEKEELIAKYYFQSSYDYGSGITNNNLNINGGE